MPEEPALQENTNKLNSAPAPPPTPAPIAPVSSADEALMQAVAEVEREPQSFNRLSLNNDAVKPSPVSGSVLSVSKPPSSFNITSPENSPKKSKKKLIIILAIIVVILLGAGAGTVFALWYSNPNKVASDAVLNLVTARTTIANGTYNFQDDSNKGNINLSFAGKEDMPNFKGQLDAHLKVNYQKYKFDLAGSGLLSENGNLYFKFDGIKKVLKTYIDDQQIKAYTESTPKLKSDLIAFVDKIDGQWVKLDQSAIKDIFNKFDYTKTKTCFSNAYDQLDKQPSQKSQLTQAYNNNAFIIIKNTGSQAINGVDSIKYAISADVAKYYKVSDAFDETDFGKAMQKCSDQLSNTNETAQEKSHAKKDRDGQVKDEQKQIDKAKLSVWISRWSHEFTKTSFNEDDAQTKTHTTFDVTYKLDQKVNASEPKKSIPFKEFQSDINKLEQDFSGVSTTPSTISVNQTNASAIANYVDDYALHHKGVYPTIAQLKMGPSTSALPSDLAAIVSADAPDASHQTRIQYTTCGDNKGYNIYYWDVSTNTKTVISHSASSCKQTI